MSTQRRISCALTIAGSDSGGGAGIQADLKTFAALGVYGCSAITAITAQNTQAVTGIWALPAAAVQQQIQAVLTDIHVGAVKLGMLFNADIVTAVAEQLSRRPNLPIICDPVMVATSGGRLADLDFATCVREMLIGKVTLLTPNVDEAAALLATLPATTVEEMLSQAQRLVELGAPAVLLTGGHLTGAEAVDILVWREDGALRQRRFVSSRVETNNNHGTGCTLSAAIAAGLAKGLPLAEAIDQAKAYVRSALEHARELTIGHGHGPLNHFYQRAFSTIDKCGH